MLISYDEHIMTGFSSVTNIEVFCTSINMSTDNNIKFQIHNSTIIAYYKHRKEKKKEKSKHLHFVWIFFYIDIC